MKINKPIRLFWRENYVKKPVIVQKAIDKSIKESVKTISLYPGAIYKDCVNVVAQSLHIKPDQIIFGHGIEGLIHLTSQAFLDKNKIGGMFEPSFFVFRNNLKRYNIITYPVRYNQKVDVDDLINKIKNTNLFFIASPSTDTGNYLLTHKQLEKIVQVYNGLLVVDECYWGMGDMTVIDLLPKHKNLLIYRGVSKVMGLASLRLGFAIGHKETINKLKFHQNDIELDPFSSFSLNVFKHTYPYYDLMAKKSVEFFNEFYEFLKVKFPQDTCIKNIVTFHFMSLKNYRVPHYKILNYMNEQGYIMAEGELNDNSSINFQELLELNPPPRERWDDFIKHLKIVLSY